jgi:glycosyltransferase involved in cell wall biosynthesis
MKVSVITPSFNQGRFIERTIQSVLTQGYQNFEYFIFDGGSTDETLPILEFYQTNHDRFKYISESDRGQAHAVNKGILRTDGDIIAWINSDDIYYANTFHKIIQIFQTYPHLSILYGQADHINEADEILEAYPVESWDYKRLTQTCYLCQPAVFFKRSIVDKMGLLDESFHYSIDYEFWLRCGKEFPFFYLDTKLAASRLYPQNKTLTNPRAVFYESSLAVKKHIGFVPDKWVLGYAFATAEAESLRNDETPVYDKVFFHLFLSHSIQNFRFWQQIPSPWGGTKLLYWFFKCFLNVRANKFCKPID